jgi:hypothetical protein
VRVLLLETHDLVLVHLGPVQLVFGICCLGVCSGGGAWTFRWVLGGSGGGSGGIHDGGGTGSGDGRNSCACVSSSIGAERLAAVSGSRESVSSDCSCRSGMSFPWLGRGSCARRLVRSSRTETPPDNGEISVVEEDVETLRV